MLAGLNEELALPILTRRPAIRRGPLYRSCHGRRVMITGAGGSIGSELVLQVAASEPDLLILVDHSEYALYEINCTLTEAGYTKAVPLLVNVRDTSAIARAFAYQPKIVFHAAALKHVPLLETEHNLIEAVLTNVAGTFNIAEACARNRARMVLVSTDKAVYPTSMMGATKRAAELAVGALSTVGAAGFCQVRFGNVLGSSGSVVPLFRRQIAMGGPITITHPDMTRYMMSIKQAVQLMLTAADLHHSIENHGSYMLDMGEPVKIVDIARRLIEQSGLRPDTDIPIEVVGMRPGEKLHEELAYEWEPYGDTGQKGVKACYTYTSQAELGPVGHLIAAAQAGSVEGIKQTLRDPTFRLQCP